MVLAATLTTARLTLRPLAEADWPAFEAIEADPDLQRWERTPLIDTKHRRLLFDRLLVGGARGYPYSARAICLRTTGTMIGFCTSWVSAGADPPGVQIGFSIARRHWGRGFATEAAQAQIHHLFTVARVERLVAGCFAGNFASARVMQKLGLRRLRPSLTERWKELLLLRRPDRDRIPRWYFLTVTEWQARDAVQ